MNNQNMGTSKLPGKNFIFVSSIILLIGAIFNIIISVPMLLSSAYWDGVWPIFIPWSIWYSYAIVASLFMIFISISGIRFCNVSEKSDFLHMLSIIMLALASITLIFNVAILSNILALTGLVLPILYFIGTTKNKKHALS